MYSEWDEWTENDAKRWNEICSKTPGELTTAEMAEGLRLAERAFKLLQLGVPVSGVALIEITEK